MAKVVFLHRSDSIYDDQLDSQYQFPAQYFGRASQCVGDWIIYLEPSKVRKRGYHAVAKVEEIVPDPVRSDIFIALIEPGTYLEFDKEVPFRDVDGYPERGVLNEFGKISGRAQSAMRPIAEADFNRIVARGLVESDEFLPRQGVYDQDLTADRLFEERSPFVFEQERSRVPLLTNRIVRDRAFRRRVLQCYDNRCALTGLKFINGGGRAEAEAAHIRSVEHDGPDSVANGIALSGTVHWMFDRGLLSLSDDLDILISSGVNDRDGLAQLLNKSGKASLPILPSLRPHPRFLKWHCEACFKA